MTRGRQVESLVESQARFYEIQRAASLPRAEEPEAGGPWLTISRQHGSGGSEIACLLGEALGWSVYDKQIIADVALKTAAPKRLLSRRDERATSRVDGYLSFFRSTVDPGQVRFQYEVRKAIERIASEGRVIILGRGANWILDDGRGLRCRIIAPLEHRVVRIAESEGVGAARARRIIREVDAGQRAFIHQAYGKNIEDPTGYDIIVNTGRLGVERTAGVVASILGSMIPGLAEGAAARAPAER